MLPWWLLAVTVVDFVVAGFLGEGTDGAAGCEAVPGRCDRPVLRESGRRGSLGSSVVAVEGLEMFLLSLV